MENKYASGIIGIGLFLLGGLCGKSIPNTNTNSNGNTITISQEVPTEKFEKIQKNSENFRKIQKNSENSEKKLNINTGTLQDFKNAKIGIGEKKYKKLVGNRPYKSVDELYEKKVIGYYTYENHREKFTVGD